MTFPATWTESKTRLSISCCWCSSSYRTILNIRIISFCRVIRLSGSRVCLKKKLVIVVREPIRLNHEDGEMNVGLCLRNGAKERSGRRGHLSLWKKKKECRYGINVACREYDKQMFAEENEFTFVCWEIISCRCSWGKKNGFLVAGKIEFLNYNN